MSENTIRWDQDVDGIVTLTLDDPNHRVNMMNDDFRSSLSAVVDRLEAVQDSITGGIATSAKDTFFAGGDLTQLCNVNDDKTAQFSAGVGKMQADFRPLGKVRKTNLCPADRG